MHFPKAVIFDWDNTLADTLDISLRATNETMAYFNRPLWTMEDLLNIPHLSLRDSFGSLFGSDALNAVDIYHQAFEKIHLSHLKVLPDADELIKYLYEAKVFMSIISNKTGKYLRSELEFLGWNRYFTCIVGSHDYACDKPSALPVVETLKKGNLTPGQDIWFVGDSSVDVQCARNTGCLPVFVGRHLDAIHQGDDVVWAHNCTGVLALLKQAVKIAV